MDTAINFVLTHRSKFESYVRRKFQMRQEDAKDVVSEALYRVLRWGFGNCQSTAEINKYFYVVLCRVVWSRAWRRSLPPFLVDFEKLKRVPDPEPLYDLDARSLAARILAYIDSRVAEGSLNFKTLKVYLELQHLKRKRGNSALHAVAREVNATHGAVRERIKRARQELRKLFLEL